jgi:membrane protein
MATKTEQRVASDAERVAKTSAKTLQGFFTKFNNDWVMNFAAALAFNLITAILPILIAILAVVGFTVGNLSPAAYAQFQKTLDNIFPSSAGFVTAALASLNKSAGLLVIIAVLVAIFGGSRLFVTIEGYFDVIYHTRPRNVIPQNIMAIVMLLIFIILTVPMFFAASIPALLQTFIQHSVLNQIPGNAFLIGALGVLISLFISWVLFEAIYIVVPNQHVSFRNSWLGALVAAVLLQIYVSFFFPFYTTHFLGSYTGNIALAVVLLVFFYYFAVILLLGAEINAFFAENVRSTPQSIPVMIHQLTSHLPTSEQAIQEQAPPSHKGEEPKDIRPKDEAPAASQSASQSAEPLGGTSGQAQMTRTVSSDLATSTGQRVKKRASRAARAGSSRALTLVELLTGTALAFVVQFYQLRRKK